MTREEAIGVIKEFVAYGEHVNAFVYKGSTSIPIEALNMAIKALEQEPSCRNTRQVDLISRQDAIDALDNIRYTDRQDWWGVLSTVENLPSVQPKRGKWIAIDDTHSQCVECGAIFCITSSNEWEVNYCPNCGARMESDEE